MRTRRRKTMAAAVALALIALSGMGCALAVRVLWPARTPIPFLRYEGGGQAVGRLIVLLPGRLSRQADFAKEGFVQIARDTGAAVDLIAVDAHLGYYQQQSLLERLHQDIVLPARQAGYREIWLAGISMGGFGALMYARAHPDTISGVLVIAPYLGEDEIIASVDGAGGLAGWAPPGPVSESDYQLALWSWLKQQVSGSNENPLLYLGYGTGDDFARANGLLAAALPHGRAFTVPGGHDWPVWRELWRRFLVEVIRE